MHIFAVVNDITVAFGAVVQKLNRHNLHAFNKKRLVGLDHVHYQARTADNVVGNLLGGNQIIETMLNLLHRVFSGINVQTLAVNPVNFAQIVNAVQMIGMRMRIQNPVHIADILGNQLRPHIRPGVNQQPDTLVFQISRSPGTHIFRIFRITAPKTRA